MKFSLVFSYILAGATTTQAGVAASAEKPPYFVLTGDSTVAVEGGWGNGFLSFLKDPADGINPAKGGATTASFRAEGLWDSTLKAVKNNKKKFSPIVTIQFGHNDQKATSGVSLEQFRKNLEIMVDEVKHAGGTPVCTRITQSLTDTLTPAKILLTSLTRRSFKDGKVIENLLDVRAEAIAAAKAKKITLLDLNVVSTEYINAIGDANATFYDYLLGDKTHLNPAGERVFGRMVVDLVLEKNKGLTKYFTPAKALSDKLAAGEFATGEE